MNQHAIRILVWASLSAICCILTWLAFRQGLNRDYESLRISRKLWSDAGGLKHSRSLAIGSHFEVSPDLQEASEKVKYWEQQVASTKRQMNTCLLAIPGVMAIIVILSI